MNNAGVIIIDHKGVILNSIVYIGITQSLYIIYHSAIIIPINQ